MNNSQSTGLDLSQVDESIRIQDDLFGFVNGKWLKEHEIPADKAVDAEFYRLHDLSEQQVLEIITELMEEKDLSTDGGKIGLIYRLFMDAGAVEDAGIEPLKPVLNDISQLTDKEQAAKYQASPTAGTRLLEYRVWNDVNNPENYMLYVSQGGLMLPDESYYREDRFAEIRKQYQSYLEKLAELTELSQIPGFGENAQEIAQRVFDFETALAKAHLNNVRLRDAEKSNNPMTLNELAAALPDFDVVGFFNHIGADSKAIQNLNFSVPEFAADANQVWKESNIETIRAWLALHAIDSLAPYLNSKLLDTRFAFRGTVLSGAPENRARWKRGVSVTEMALGEALGHEYVKRHFPPQAKAAMEDLVASLIEAYRKSIENLSWMSSETKEKALLKLSKFTPKIGYPDKFKDYSKLELDESSLLRSMLRVKEFNAHSELEKLTKPVDKAEWHMFPQTVNAYYNPTANEIVFPAAILQSPFFDLEADDAVNYGSIGAVIGHEIGHGFDDQGSKFDGDGILNSWWTQADRDEFEKRTKALIADYEAMSPRDLANEHHVNGSLTIGENIGDLGGLSIALKAYLAKAGEQAYEIGADGYTGIQRLFIAWGVIWRSKSRAEEALKRLATDPHSPAEFRANGVLRHIDAFYEAFDVKPGDGMYLEPAERVSIW